MCFTSLWKYSWINQVAARWHQINWSRLLFTALLKRRDLERLDSGFVGPPRRSERLEWGGSRRHFFYCVLFLFFLQLYSFNAYSLQFRTRLYKNSRSGWLDCKIWNSQTRSPFIYIAAQCVNDTLMQFVWQCCSCFLSEVLVQLSDNNSSSDWSARVDVCVCVCVWLFFFRGGLAVCCWDGQADTSSVSWTCCVELDLHPLSVAAVIGFQITSLWCKDALKNLLSIAQRSFIVLPSIGSVYVGYSSYVLSKHYHFSFIWWCNALSSFSMGPLSFHIYIYIIFMKESGKSINSRLLLNTANTACAEKKSLLLLDQLD